MSCAHLCEFLSTFKIKAAVFVKDRAHTVSVYYFIRRECENGTFPPGSETLGGSCLSVPRCRGLILDPSAVLVGFTDPDADLVHSSL